MNFLEIVQTRWAGGLQQLGVKPERAQSGIGSFLQDRARRILGETSAARLPRVSAQELTRAEKPAPPHQLPEGAFEVSKVSPEQLQKLKSSKDPKDHRLAATIERSRTAYADMIHNGSEVIAQRLESNGGYPVVTILPPGFDRNREARVHTHYHGYHSTVADPKGHGAGLTQRLEQIQKRDAANGQQTVVVLPEASNAPDQGGRVATNWSHVLSQSKTTQEALSTAGVQKPGYRVVSAHSGGGDALTYAIARDKTGAGLQADRLELQDCLYGSQGPIAQWGKTEPGRAARQVVYYHGTNESGRDQAFKSAFPGRYHYVPVGHPKASEIPQVHSPSGQSLPAFNANPHDRTKGEFLDSFPDQP